jgi:SAM-dependent methyltransferase
MSEWVSTIYDKNLKFTTPLPDESYLISLSKDIRILDAGCGYGRTIVYLYNLGFRDLTGFDISKDYLIKARRDCPEADLFVASFKSFNLEKEYDLILLMGVVEYLLTDEEQDIFFEKISKNLFTNGHILLETFIIDLKSNWKQYLLGLIRTFHWGRFRNSKGFECHHQSIRSIKKILRKYFIIETSLRRDYSTWTGNVCKGYQFNLKKI